VNRAKEGLYDVTFDQPFSEIPAVAATQIYPDQTDNDGGDTRDNVVAVYVRKDACRLKTGDSGGNAKDRDFSFVVCGI
jgi:hypothetical protein